MPKKKIINVVVAGLGGQGVLKASDILAEAAFEAGYDVKKSEIHGMSQRGGSVSSDVRFGEKVFSPMVTRGEADYLVVLTPDQVEINCHMLRDRGKLIAPDLIEENELENKRSMNVALLGALSAFLDIPEEKWMNALQRNLPEKLLDMNRKAFAVGKKKITDR